MGWLTGYTYRKKKPVNATAAGAQTNYQMQLLVGESSGASGEEIDCENHCQDFPNDIRFTGADGTTKHDYWVQSTTGTTPNRLATIWIEVASIPASGDVDLYMYYGKSSDSGESSGDNTFVLYNMANVVAFWQMDEASWNGTPDEVEDETGTNDGTGKEGATTDADGKFNRCGIFNGTSAYVDCGNDASLGMGANQDFTIFFWAKPDQLRAQHIFSKEGHASSPNLGMLSCRTSSIGKPYMIIRANTGGSTYTVTADAATQTDAFTFVAGIREGSNIRIYHNGTMSSDVSATASALTNNLNLELGRYNYDGNLWYDGRVDSLAVIKQALSEITLGKIENGYMQKMGNYYNVREWASPEPTWGTSGGEESEGGAFVSSNHTAIGMLMQG